MEELEEYQYNPNCGSDGEKSAEGEERTANPPWCEMELPLRIAEAAAEPFRLEKAVCSHGLFMMAPNHWDPLSKTLTRSLRLSDDDDLSSGSRFVTISQPSQRPGSLIVRVRGTQSLSHQQERALRAQVSRMLRLSEAEEKAVREFRDMHNYSVDDQNKSFCGRVFRSPTLFEDMVKCILFCNCQWSRTLSMAQGLCELQWELQNGSSLVSGAKGAVTTSDRSKVETLNFIPKTPAAKEASRKRGAARKGMFLKKKLELEVDENSQIDYVLVSSLNATLLPSSKDGSATKEPSSDDSFLQFPNEKEYFTNGHIGDFPSPKELANLDESFLAKRCKLGYRASRIIKLAQAIVEGKIQLRQLEELSKDANLSSYEQLEDQLKQIEGFGPFTRANVLMCMGYYHVIPTDSETIRHLKTVHSRNSTSQTIQRDVEEIYGKYEPYQFLAYWSEIWDFYERRFGKLHEMHCSHYKLITASNMRSAGKGKRKRKRAS